MKVFIVTAGSYSDKRTDSVFTDEKVADLYAAANGYYVEEHDVDPEVDYRILDGQKPWWVGSEAWSHIGRPELPPMEIQLRAYIAPFNSEGVDVVVKYGEGWAVGVWARSEPEAKLKATSLINAHKATL